MSVVNVYEILDNYTLPERKSLYHNGVINVIWEDRISRKWNDWVYSIYKAKKKATKKSIATCFAKCMYIHDNSDTIVLPDSKNIQD